MEVLDAVGSSEENKMSKLQGARMAFTINNGRFISYSIGLI